MKTVPTLAAFALVLGVAAPAAAQLATNSKAPVDVTADDLRTDNKSCIATYTGNVEALQDTARLRTDLLKVFATPNARGGSGGGSPMSNSCGGITRIEAHGAVYYVSPQQRVHGDDAIYEATPDTLTVTGDVVAVQGQNVLRGTRMVINNQTGEGHMESDVKGRNKPGRVRGVFYPNQSNNTAQQPGAAPPAKPR
jgi:lipopolysaccharide export system protein LptA